MQLVERSLCKQKVERSRLSASRYIFLLFVSWKKKDDEVPVEIGDDGKQERRVDVRARKSTSV